MWHRDCGAVELGLLPSQGKACLEGARFIEEVLVIELQRFVDCVVEDWGQGVSDWVAEEIAHFVEVVYCRCWSS